MYASTVSISDREVFLVARYNSRKPDTRNMKYAGNACQQFAPVNDVACGT